MIISSAEFRCSSQKVSQVPNDGLRDYAFIGRSNVGKSSLVNRLTGRKLAKVSGTPGKTKLINHFLINKSWYLVDLPGYGYARTSKSQKEQFSQLIVDYVKGCEKMHFLFVLVDSRLEPQRIDVEFMEMCGVEGIPFGIVFTKSDKLGVNKLASNIAAYKRRLLESWEELPPIFVTSSESGVGCDSILDFVEQCENQTKL